MIIHHSLTRDIYPARGQAKSLRVTRVFFFFFFVRETVSRYYFQSPAPTDIVTVYLSETPVWYKVHFIAFYRHHFVLRVGETTTEM